jgi:capsular exopolysaccharide synthesis family protein
MSEIFDALQRRGKGSSEDETDSPLHAFDVLRRAEKQAQEKWERSSGSATDMSEVTGLDALLRRGALASEPAPAPQESLPASLTTSSFEQAVSPQRFSALPVSVSPDSHLVCVADSDGPAAEAFRLLGVRLRDLRDNRSLKRLLITSTVPREGKSTVAANLACTLARSSRSRTLLLEGDVRRPTQGHIFGLDKDTPGLCEWLQGNLELTKCIHHLDFLGFWIMPAGNCPSGNPLGLLHPARLASLMKQLGEHFDLIIVDSPPVLPLADTSIWMKLVDGILLVTRHGVTERRPLQRGIEAIAPEKLIGTVMNSSTSLPHTDYYYSASPPAEPAARAR